MKKIGLLLFITLLASCNSYSSLVRAEEVETVTGTFTFNEYENINIHTTKQTNYLNDSYQNIANYAQGVEELSRPNTFTLEWSFETNSLESVNDYYLNVTTDKNLRRFDTYICPTNSYIFPNLMIGTTYYYYVTANLNSLSFGSDIHTFTTQDVGPRNVRVSGVTNARDMGGYLTEQGHRVKQGMVFRMGQLNNSYKTSISPKISLEGRKTMIDDFKIKSEIDLREVYNNESGGLYDSILGKDVNYFPYHMSWDVTHAAQNEKDMLNQIFNVFANRNNYPIVFHCAIGTDRTGVVAFYLGALLGFSTLDLYHDYLFSNFGNIGGQRGLDNINAHFAYLSTFEGNNNQERAYNYFMSIGLEKDQLDTICEIMLEK